MSLSVVVAGGGTAGHVEPALATAARLAEAGHRVTMLGTTTGLEQRLVPARGFDLRTIPRVPFPRRPSMALARLPTNAAAAVRAAGAVCDDVAADVVIGYGGYVAFPAYLAARRRKLGIVVHEANPLPGLANRVGARLTRFVGVAHEGTPLRHARVVGIPLRASITGLDRAAGRAPARAAFGLPSDGFVTLVFGGSQGSASLNTAFADAAPALADAGVTVLLAAGTANFEAVGARVTGTTTRVLPYLDDMPAAYAAADLAVCRSGAMTCAEVAAVGLPAIYVPLPIGNGEQRLNAEPTVAAGGGLLIEDADLGSELLPLLLSLAGDPARVTAMGAAARRTQSGDAAGELLAMVEAAAAVRRRP